MHGLRIKSEKLRDTTEKQSDSVNSEMMIKCAQKQDDKSKQLQAVQKKVNHSFW